MEKLLRWVTSAEPVSTQRVVAKQGRRAGRGELGGLTGVSWGLQDRAHSQTGFLLEPSTRAPPKPAPLRSPVGQCPEQGSLSTRSLTARRVWGEPPQGECGSGHRCTRRGPAEHCLGRTRPSRQEKRHGIPRPSLPAACRAEGTAQKQPASLREKQLLSL